MSLLFAETQATDSRNGFGKLVTFCFQVADTKIIGPPRPAKTRKTQ
jgi:hypothetical protein